MALVLQNDNGNVAGANAYGTVAAFRAYHSDRGTVTSAYLDPAVDAAIVRATAYLDVRFNYVGQRLNLSIQTTQWPRLDAVDRDDNLVTGIPLPVVQATFEYALRALSSPLMPDPERDGSGQIVTQITQKVGDLSEYKQFGGLGSYNIPDYPLADGILRAAGLVRRGRKTVRT